MVSIWLLAAGYLLLVAYLWPQVVDYRFLITGYRLYIFFAVCLLLSQLQEASSQEPDK